MATQVETLLPGNPLSKHEDHGAMICGELEQGQRDGRGDEAELGSPCAGQGGTHDSKQLPDSHKEPKGDSDNDNKPSEEGGRGKREFTEAPPPKVNPWTKKMNAVTVVSVNGQALHESTGPTKVVRAGNPPKTRRGGKVGDFGDTNSWPTPGEIATKDTQMVAVSSPTSVRQVRDSWRAAPPKRSSQKKELKEKRESIEESKENLKSKSDDSGEDKNPDEDGQRNGPKKKGNKQKWVPLMIEVKSEGPRERSASRNNSRPNESPRVPPTARNDLRGED